MSNIVKLEQKVNQTSKALNILQRVSHELKTPMNQIINFQIQLSEHKNEISSFVSEKLNKSISMSKYLLSLVRDMIDYCYIKSNNFGMTFD